MCCMVISCSIWYTKLAVYTANLYTVLMAVYLQYILGILNLYCTSVWVCTGFVFLVRFQIQISDFRIDLLELSPRLGSMSCIGGADRTFASKSQECLWQDWYGLVYLHVQLKRSLWPCPCPCAYPILNVEPPDSL